MHHRRLVVETGASGKHKFAKLKRSHSHNEHSHRYFDDTYDRHFHRHLEYGNGHRHYTDSEYYMVRRDDWLALKERDHILTDNNKALNDSNKRLIADNRDLNRQITTLQADNQSLRRSVDRAAESAANHHKEVERLQDKIDKLEQENQDLRARVRSLLRQLDDGEHSGGRRLSELLKDVEYWKEQARYWKAKYFGIVEDMEIRTERMKSYEEILRRNGFL